MKIINFGILIRKIQTQLRDFTQIGTAKRGEHASCGDGITNSGWAYDPEDFMAGGIAHYAFGWPDLGVPPSYEYMLRIVQVIARDLSNNNQNGEEKQACIAVHCHAGLGRTGTAIACYFVYNSHRMSPKTAASSAVDAVRRARPGSLQTAKQVDFVFGFARYLKVLAAVYPIVTDFNDTNIKCLELEDTNDGKSEDFASRDRTSNSLEHSKADLRVGEKNQSVIVN
ncbi:Protein tyrosine phosphatase domain-containing protein 1 [Physocladia obscura]|uniref:Protein tyrosine phosphatase domain-containing protein 1 n=1 Tax=Physocladia obscura TaxID=109957 RepID=A0AAD5T401_9FUNG|nr:Protein tyrosine phosphatase domain-containing protein 1 [Physocladia obscura]